MKPAPIVLLRDQGKQLETEVRRLVKTTAAETDGKLALTIVSFPAATAGPPLHVHHGNDEALYVLEGDFVIQIADETLRLGAGGFAYIPGGTPHGFSNLSEAPGRMMEMFLPGEFGDYFAEVAAVLAAGGPRDDIGALHTKYGLEVVGTNVAAP